MNLRVFEVRFKSLPGTQINLVNKIFDNLNNSKTVYNQETTAHQRDINASTSDRQDRSQRVLVREAASSFSYSIKGVSAVKRGTNLIRFKYYTDDPAGPGMEFRFRNYHKRHSIAKVQPKFHQTFFLYIFSKQRGAVFVPCVNATKVNDLFHNEFKTLLELESADEIRFEGARFDRILNKILTTTPDNIVDRVNYIGASVKDVHMGKCYMSLSVQHKKSYQTYLEFKRKFNTFKLKIITFTTEIEDAQQNVRHVKITLQSNSKYPMNIRLRGSFSGSESLLSWLTRTLI
jgi:hypothetical protein